MTVRRRPDQIDSDVVRALDHPLRVQILQILNERDASSNELAALLGVAIGNIAYHTRVLQRCACIELLGTEQRRGAVERYFRAVPRSDIGHQEWDKVPRSVRSQVSGATVDCFMKRLTESFQAGKIDDEDDSTLTWMSLTVDEVGWAQAEEVLSEAISRLHAVHEQSRSRLEMTGGDAVPVIVGLAAFEAAQDSRP
jgi:DNA-binding transcriptional ArsR family regulator